MSFKCFFGHQSPYANLFTVQIVDKEKGIYTYECVDCKKRVKQKSLSLVMSYLSSTHTNMFQLAWMILGSYFQSFSGENKHSITYHLNGDIVLRADLAADDIARLRSMLNKTSASFSNWQVIPLLKSAK